MLKKIFAIVIVAVVPLSATILPFPSSLPAVSGSYDDVLKKTWEGVKKRMVDPYEIPLVHRTRSEEPHDAVSEGVGYGMLLALYCNDQTYFDKIWDAGEKYMWDDNGNQYNWRVNREGTVIGSGAASDADQDIALALIFADGLVKKQVWKSHTSPKGADYAKRANSIINNLWNTMVEGGRYLRPGNLWGGRAFQNPGYFAPAFYRVFDEFEAEHHNWPGVIDQSYMTIEASPGYALGLVPDWMQPDGKFAGKDQLGYNAYAGGNFMYKDAIRVLWRLATDYLWYNEPRAKKYCDNAFAFIKSADKANFFQMDGSAVTESFVLGNEVSRPRSEHSSLTIGMWACAVMASGGAEATEPFSKELLTFYEGGDYWGKASDANNEDTLHNEMYFEQFLSWFGASLISGVFTNLWDDFKDPNPEVLPDFVGVPKVGPFDIDANKEPLSVKAAFNKSLHWSVEIVHRDDKSTSVVYGGSSDSVDIRWNGTSADGKSMKQGAFHVTITARGIKTPFTKTVWLGRSLDLKSGSRLIVDNFADGDLHPFFGSSWGSYTEQSDGKNGKTSIRKLAVTTDASGPVLEWLYRLDGSQNIGFNPYAALEWNCASSDSTFTLAGLDTIIIRARCEAASPLGLSVQIITSDIGDYTYFEDSLYLDNQFKVYSLPVKEFKQRLGGSGRQLNLSKCTGIRFQAQNVDGTENGILMREMLFAGNLASLYTSPPAYIQPEPGLAVVPGRAAVSAGLSVSQVNGQVRITLPAAGMGEARCAILDLYGRQIATQTSRGSRYITWNFRDSGNRRVAAGTYYAVITSALQVYRTPLLYLP